MYTHTHTLSTGTLQAAFRGILSRKETREIQKLEFDSALLIQSMWRGYLSRRRAAFERMSKMATRVQRLWRSKIARDKADAMWLRRPVVKIQKIARIFIQGRVFFQKRREQVVRAATQIQRFFRSYAAQKRRHKKKTLENEKEPYQV